MSDGATMRFVRHAKRPGWGIGRVLRADGKKVEVYFEAVGHKVLDAAIAGLLDAPDDDVGPADLLRNLKPDAEGRYATPPLTFEEMVQNFLRIEGGGFDHPKYIKDERDYKDKAIALAADLLSPARVAEALASGDHRAVFEGFRKVVGATNLVSVFEKARLGAVPPERHASFAGALAGVLFATDDFDTSFDVLAETFVDLGIGTWPTCTYGLFMTRPKEHLVVKPMFVKRAADALGYEINYESTPSARTYRRILGFASYVREKLVARGMPPKDMVDVQGFIWLGTGGADEL